MMFNERENEKFNQHCICLTQSTEAFKKYAKFPILRLPSFTSMSNIYSSKNVKWDEFRHKRDNFPLLYDCVEQPPYSWMLVNLIFV